jgi:membrane fusion protein, heavy metal efflux system
MDSNRSRHPWIWIVAAAAMGSAVTWFSLNAITAHKAPSMPSPPNSAPAAHVAALNAPALDVPSEQADVTISPADLDRLHLKFAKVTESPVSVEVRVPGTVQPDAYKQVHVTSLAGGIVTQVAAELGQQVKRGQILTQIFSHDLAEAQTAYISVNAELEAEHKKLERLQDLVRVGAASRQQLEQVEADHQMHAAHVEEARQKLVLLGLDDAQVARVAAGNQLSPNIPVPSPLDGVITARNVNSAQVVIAAQDLFTATDLSSVWVEANLFENDFGAVQIGSPAVITTPAYTGRQYRGVVSYIDPQVTPETHTAKVRVAVDNTGLALRLGMYMDVVFTIDPNHRPCHRRVYSRRRRIRAFLTANHQDW